MKKIKASRIAKMLGYGVMILSVLILPLGALHDGWWILRNAEVLKSREGIIVYDARPLDKRGAWSPLGTTEVVDASYSFLRQCIPLRDNEAARMKHVRIVIREEPLSIFFLPTPSVEAYHAFYMWPSELIMTDSINLPHEWIHHFLGYHPFEYEFWRRFFKNPVTLLYDFVVGSIMHKDPLFRRCEAFPSIFTEVMH